MSEHLVSDAGSNVILAQNNISEMYPQILSVHCIAQAYLCAVAFTLHPIKKKYHYTEITTSHISGLFLGLVRLGAAIKRWSLNF
ncbi:1879_t:CDS:2 [Ambispora gerdemannii]|uniref:1879_t:CDS:1 n=1 Tax=Ambispora gerdemannii TaxID=144530 RepID=A0A9N8ZS61_9GLOM|nr:1879_t:CDS:2 [Ambispora gerdemannii]